MAGIQQRGSGFRVIYRYHGKQDTLRLGKVSEQEAHTKAAQVDYLLMRLQQGLIQVPAGSTLKDFLFFDGKPPARAEAVLPPSSKSVTLGDLRDRYLATHKDSLEDRTLDTIRLHLKHLWAGLGAGFALCDLARRPSGVCGPPSQSVRTHPQAPVAYHDPRGSRVTPQGLELGRQNEARVRPLSE